MNLRVRIAALVAAASIVGCKGGGNGTNEAKTEVIRVTGIPDENPTELQRKFQPMVDFLEGSLGRKVEYVPVTDYGAAVQALSAKKVDFAWLGGFTFVQAKHLASAEPLCMRDIDRDFKSVFVTSKPDKIKSLADLKGKKFAFGSKSSTSGHLMPRHFMMTEAKLDPDKDLDGAPVFSGAHDATVKLVESGSVDAGALNIEVWDRLVSDKKVDTAKVSVFWTTPGYVDYVWATRGDLDPEMKEKFKAAFLALDASNPQHKAVLDLQGAKKFVPASMSDFDAVETVAKSTGLLK